MMLKVFRSTSRLFRAPPPAPTATAAEYPQYFSLPAINKIEEFVECKLHDDILDAAVNVNRKKFGGAPLVRIDGGLVGDLGWLFTHREEEEEELQSQLKEYSAVGGFQWPFTIYFENRKTLQYHLVWTDDFDAWKRLRQRIQSGLLAPQDPWRYIDAIQKTADSVSEHVTDRQNGVFRDYSLKISFDFIYGVIFGQPSGAPANKHPPEDQAFLECSSEALGKMLMITLNPEASLAILTGAAHPLWDEFVAAMDTVTARGEQLVQEAVRDLTAKGGASRFANSYIAHQLREELAAQKPIDPTELIHNIITLFFAGVDTTGYIIRSMVYDLAKHPEVQDAVAADVASVLRGANVDRDTYNELHSLHAVFRETARVHGINRGYIRCPHHEVTLNGVTVPPYVKIFTWAHKTVMSEEFVGSDPYAWRPERWAGLRNAAPSSDVNSVGENGASAQPVDVAVAAANGCPHAQKKLNKGYSGVISSLFGRGPRMCVGYRLAMVEIITLTARLLQDYTFTVDPSSPPAKFTSALGMPQFDPYPSIVFTPRQAKNL